MGELHQHSRCQHDDTRKHLTLQFGIGKGKTLSHYCHGQSCQQHSIVGNTVNLSQQHANHHHDEYQIDKERQALRQEEAVKTEQWHLLGWGLEGETHHRYQHKGCKCQHTRKYGDVTIAPEAVDYECC